MISLLILIKRKEDYGLYTMLHPHFWLQQGRLRLKVGQAEMVELLRRSYIELALFLCSKGQ
jgi:hypothetical protein